MMQHVFIKAQPRGRALFPSRVARALYPPGACLRRLKNYIYIYPISISSVLAMNCRKKAVFGVFWWNMSRHTVGFYPLTRNFEFHCSA